LNTALLRPQQALGGISLACGFIGALTGTLCVYLRTDDPAAVDCLLRVLLPDIFTSTKGNLILINSLAARYHVPTIYPVGIWSA
jgi:hypothetical protein